MGSSTREEPERIARREALKKAAAAAGAVGAVWAAPKVEGLSLVPTYAAAATATPGGDVTITIGSSGNENNVGSGCNPGNHHFAMTQLLTSPYAVRPSGNSPVTHTNTPGVSVSGPTRGRGGVPGPTSQPTSWPSEPATIYRMENAGDVFNVSAPLGTGVGNVTVGLANPVYRDSDLDSNKVFTVSFNVDPPFNKCRVTEAILHACLREPNGDNNNRYLNSYNANDHDRKSNSNGSYPQRPVVGPSPGINPTNSNNNTPSFSQPVTLPNVFPGDAVRAIQFKISCV